MQHLQRFPYIGSKLCTHQCECMDTKNSSFTEERTCVLCIAPSASKSIRAFNDKLSTNITMCLQIQFLVINFKHSFALYFCCVMKTQNTTA